MEGSGEVKQTSGRLLLCSYAVCFKDLYSLRAPVGTVEGFDISAFDRRVR